MKNKTQNMILVRGNNGQIIVRGVDISPGQAKIYGQEYLNNVYATKAIEGRQALAMAIFGTRILDVDADCIL
jgi:hypothetical protein